MRAPTQLVHSRTRLGRRYALFPLDGYQPSQLPSWWGTPVRVLASPALGAAFVQYLVDLPAAGLGYVAADEGIETFYYVLAGDGRVNDGGSRVPLRTGSFGLVPPGVRAEFASGQGPMSLLVLRKRYEPYDLFAVGKGAGPTPGPVFDPLHSHESAVPQAVWADNPHSLLQPLVPDERAYDLAMNIFAFDPGYGLPVVETHVMEHGALILHGKGLYHLDGDWMEVEKDDFIYMGPYCPQSFYATGPTPAKYIYYKNVNRDIAL